MQLKVLLPAGMFLEVAIRQVRGEGPAGEFCLKPRHIDYVTALVPGIMSYLPESGPETFIALDGGILTKQGAEVKIASRQAVAGNLGDLRAAVERMQLALDEKEKKSRSAVAGLEINFLRRFLEFGGQ